MPAIIHLVSITLDQNGSWPLIPWCGHQHSACGQYKEPFSGYFESGLDWSNPAKMVQVITSSPWIIKHKSLWSSWAIKPVGFCEGEIINFLVTSKTQTVTIWCLENLASKSQSLPEMAAHVLFQKNEEKISSLFFSVMMYTIWATSFFSQSKLSKWAEDNQVLYFQAVYFLGKRFNPF